MTQAPFDNIVQHLFHQPSLHSVTISELEKMTHAHPYFAAAHFLLLKKMQDANDPRFTDQLHRTSLYFSNPLWLQYLLQPGPMEGFRVTDEAPFLVEEPLVDKHHAINAAGAGDQDEQGDPDATELPEQTEGATQDDSPAIPLGEWLADANPLYAPALQTAEDAAPDAGQSTVQEMDIAPEETAASANESTPVETEQQWTDDGKGEPGITAAEEIRDIPALPADAPGAMAPATGDAQPETTAPAVEANAEAQTQFEPGEPAITETDAAGSPAPDSGALATGEHQAIELPDTPVTIIETPAAKDDLLFEPYHTVDYFASQGIKLSKAELDGKDKLGRQLRSFTDWLKTMKKLPKASIDQMLGSPDDTRVVADANQSIETKEVITEAMAEVFEKQGLNDQAAAIYRKLSLQNPGKSAYFAAKIDALKQ